VEQLEDRMVPSNFTAATASDLIADINAANQQGGSNTITLVAPTSSPYVLSVADNYTSGWNGLPVIAANDNLTVIGNGDTIERGPYTSAFRLVDVAAGASLTLQNMTLQGGRLYGLGVEAQGGAIHNQGTLDLNGVTVQNNLAQAAGVGFGETGGSAMGGGITTTTWTATAGFTHGGHEHPDPHVHDGRRLDSVSGGWRHCRRLRSGRRVCRDAGQGRGAVAGAALARIIQTPCGKAAAPAGAGTPKPQSPRGCRRRGTGPSPGTCAQ
jgi:hypothetical protein